MNDLQQVQMSILKEFAKICVSHNITYSLGYGTLLGAIRHRGFIPWDDDIDIIMMRNDFEKLESIWTKCSDHNLFLQTYKSDPDYPYPFAKIRDRRTTFVERGNEHLDIVHGIFIDIFLVDYIPTNRIYRFWQLFCAEMVWILVRKNVPGNGWKGLMRKFICAFFSDGSRMDRLKSFERQIGKYSYEEAVHIANLNYGTGWAAQVFPKDMFCRLEKSTFEGDSFLISKDYDAILSMRYGDYMTFPPEKDRVSGHAYTIADTGRPYTEVIKHP